MLPSESRYLATDLPSGQRELITRCCCFPSFAFTNACLFVQMLQFNTYLFAMLGLKCLSRANMGGGPGGPLPYRIYVDSGTIFLCLTALAPASPLLAPVALFNFACIIPLLRRNTIFVYRPKYDAGGVRWQFLCTILLSCLLTGQIMLTAQMALKLTIAPTVLAALPIIPIFSFRNKMQQQFCRAFRDTALLQTSNLDGWNTTDATSVDKREKFRRFLVDSHKAAYVPVCVAGGAVTRVLTAEPAAVVPCLSDPEPEQALGEEVPSMVSVHRRSTGFVAARRVHTARHRVSVSIDDGKEKLVDSDEFLDAGSSLRSSADSD